MAIKTDKLLEEIVNNFRLIDINDIPNIDLYMDQVTTFMDERLQYSKRYDDDKILTKTMINNYAKNDLIPPPEKKKYSKEHIIMLTFIYYFKNVMSINDIKTVLNQISDKYFNSNNDINIEDIYKEISSLQQTDLTAIETDIRNKTRLTKEAFGSNLKGDNDFLQLFSLICMLSFDVYAKKQIIESIVDEMRKKYEQTPKKEEKKKEKSEK